MALTLQDAAAARDAITAKQRWEIHDLYFQWAKEIGERADYWAKKQTSSSVLLEQQARELRTMLYRSGYNLTEELCSGIKSNLYLTADSVVRNAAEWMSQFGFSEKGISASFVSVPDQVVRNLVTGNIYEGGWNLSSRIWGSTESTLADCYKLVAQGVAMNLPIADIARMLEGYVQPGAKKMWNPKLPMLNTLKGNIEFKRIYNKQVDYNAQRLARTLVQHSYQQSFVAVTKDNPFVEDYIWRSNGSRVCPLCADRDGQHFPKDALPLDHPNGMCTMEPNVNRDAMIDQLANWINEPDGTYPELDEFARNFGYDGGNAYKASLYGTSWNVAKDKVGQNWYNAQKYMSSQGTSAASYWKSYINGTIQDPTLDGILGFNGTVGTKVQVQTVKKAAAAKKSQAAKAAVEAAVQSPKPFSASEWAKQLADQQSYETFDEYLSWCRKWQLKLDSEEEDAVTWYTGSHYSSMNGHLRFGKRISSSNLDAIENCTKALDKASLPKDTIVRRGSGYNMLEELGFSGSLTPQQIADIVGATVTDKGFTSTSPASSGGFTDDFNYIINVPKGSHAMYVAPISEYRSEEELLIQRDSRYRIEGIELDESGMPRNIYMTLLGTH